MNVEQRPNGWWIVGVPDTVSECGPYATRAEAEADRVGMSRFFRRWEDPEWMEGIVTANLK
jgi:hypothetical protein